MTLDEYLNDKPSSALAEALGVSASQLSQWRSGFRIPSPQSCVAIERATGGKVTRKDLRPHDWHLIWIELDAGQKD